MFGSVVFDIPHKAFEEVLHKLKHDAGVTDDNQLSPAQLKTLINEYKLVYTKYNHVFISDPYEQLYTAIVAVFNSWNSDRAIKYREAESISGLLGTAVNVQSMVSIYEIYACMYAMLYENNMFAGIVYVVYVNILYCYIYIHIIYSYRYSVTWARQVAPAYASPATLTLAPRYVHTLVYVSYKYSYTDSILYMPI